MVSKRLYGAGLMAAVVLPALIQGCSSDNPLCCTEYKAGTTVDVNIGGDAQAKVAVQAVGDFAAIASALVDDITTVCRNIAVDLDGVAGNTTADRDAAEAKADKRDRLNAYCGIAVKALGTASASAKLTINVTPPKCEASVSAKAECQARCSGGSAQCDVSATPPTCRGGTLEVSCNGSCNVTVEQPKISCEGSCEVTAEGSCTVTQGSVACTGRCNGTCSADANVANSGIQADGTCNGMCAGTCEVVKPGVKCDGTFKGTCSGSCMAQGGVAAKCNGSCDVKAEPISCTGGTLEGGCKVEAPQCEANCNASVQAKAECTPPAVDIRLEGTATAKLKTTLEDNLPRLLAFRARLKAMGDLAGTITGNAGAVASIKVACIPIVVSSAVDAGQDVTTSFKATADIATSLNIPPAS